MSLVCVFFFFKQKTAYEMRISDWSSDVCSSDLAAERNRRAGRYDDRWRYPGDTARTGEAPVISERVATRPIDVGTAVTQSCREIGRASCRERVCQSCRSRWSPYH